MVWLVWLYMGFVTGYTSLSGWSDCAEHRRMWQAMAPTWRHTVVCRGDEPTLGVELSRPGYQT